MKARIAAGWTVDQLWDRFADPEGIAYDMAVPNTLVEPEEGVASGVVRVA